MDTRTLQSDISAPSDPYCPSLANNCCDVSRPQSALALHDVNYYVKYYQGPWWKGACFRKQHLKHVLNDVNLLLPVGQLVGLVGSSGSGKTSLLDIISFRNEGYVTGCMTYKGTTCRQQAMRQCVSYVIQADRLLPNLTVRETLTYTAFLKLPDSVGAHQVKHKVSSVIDRMGLRGVADSRVGGAVVRGISGGEKRRVTIALQLLKDPDILLMDEPTTGLDSFTARRLVENVQEVARQGKLVVVSLHQPRSDIVKLLDQTVIMCQGHVVYHGSTNQLVPYFTSLGYPCPTYANPLDTYIDVTSVDRRDADRLAMTQQRVDSLLNAYLTSELLKQTKDCITAASKTLSTDLQPKAKSPGWFRTFFTVYGRLNVNLWRDKQAWMNRMVMLPLFVPFILVFLGRFQHNQRSIQDRIGILYQSLQVPPYIGIMNNVALFPVLRDHFYREGLDGLYSSPTFLLAYLLHVLPFMAIASLAYSASLYWISGMQPGGERFAMFLAVVFLLHIAGELVAVALMGVFRNPQLTNTTASLLFTTSSVIASGFLRTMQDMFKGLQWLSWVSVHKYASEILVANEFHNLNLTCEEQITGVPCIPNGDFLISVNYPGAVDHMVRNFSVIVGLLVGYQLLGILSFKLAGLKVMN